MSRPHTKRAWYHQVGSGPLKIMDVARLVDIATKERFLEPGDLAALVLFTLCSDKHPDTREFYDAWTQAAEINELGVTEQVFWLVEEFGLESAEEIIRSKGGVLLALARAATEGVEK